MKIKKITFIDKKYDQYDISTSIENFYIKTNKSSCLIHNSPAIFAGTDPMDGKFFVGTKSIFNKNPKLVKNKRNLQELFGDQPTLYARMKAAFLYLRTIKIPSVMQGDMLFTKASIKYDEINDEKLLIFKPNLIVYTVPANSNLAKEITSAEIGIVWHTLYTGGPTLQDMQAQFITSAPKGNKKVWSRDAALKDLTGIASLSENEGKKIQASINKIDTIIDKINVSKFNNVVKNKEFLKFIEPFINQKIKAGEAQVSNVAHFLKDFMAYYESKILNGMNELNGSLESRVGQKRIAKIEEYNKFVIDNNQTIIIMLGIYKHIVALKTILISKLSKIEGMGTFYKTANGYEVTSHEGFVAIDHDGNAIKLVNRIDFSARNFQNIN